MWLFFVVSLFCDRFMFRSPGRTSMSCIIGTCTAIRFTNAQHTMEKSRCVLHISVVRIGRRRFYSLVWVLHRAENMKIELGSKQGWKFAGINEAHTLCVCVWMRPLIHGNVWIKHIHTGAFHANLPNWSLGRTKKRFSNDFVFDTNANWAPVHKSTIPMCHSGTRHRGGA